MMKGLNVEQQTLKVSKNMERIKMIVMQSLPKMFRAESAKFFRTHFSLMLFNLLIRLSNKH